jgi:hypothetical protein
MSLQLLSIFHHTCEINTSWFALLSKATFEDLLCTFHVLCCYS